MYVHNVPDPGGWNQNIEATITTGLQIYRRLKLNEWRLEYPTLRLGYPALPQLHQLSTLQVTWGLGCMQYYLIPNPHPLTLWLWFPPTHLKLSWGQGQRHSYFMTVAVKYYHSLFVLNVLFVFWERAVTLGFLLVLLYLMLCLCSFLTGRIWNSTQYRLPINEFSVTIVNKHKCLYILSK